MNIKRFLVAGWIGNSIAVLTGALLTLAFAPFNLYPLAIICPALLLSLWLFVNPKHAFLRGWLFGIGLFGTGIYWVFHSVYAYGNASAWLASLITGGFVALLALFPASCGYLLVRFFPYHYSTKLMAAFPTLWVLLEWVRSWLFSGFPWLLIGSSQIDSPLRGYAPLVSVYGVSLAAVISSGLIVNAILQAKQERRRICYVNLLLLVALWIIGEGFSFIQWTQPKQSPIKVSLVQGNIPEHLNWSVEEIEPTLEHYQQLSAAHWDSQLVIWPEGAVPISLQESTEFLDEINQIAKQHHATFITGIPVRSGTGLGYYNGVIALGEGKGYYLKRRLVPFGEYTPLSFIFNPILHFLHIPAFNYLIPAQVKMQPISTNGLRISSFICYEIAFPEQVLTRDGNINLLLTVNNDAWFGHSIAEAQHLQMAQMRAIELARPVLFVSNDGMTAVVNAKGKIQSIAPQYQSFVLTDWVQATVGKTPLQRFALDPLFLLLLFLVFISIRQQRQ